MKGLRELFWESEKKWPEWKREWWQMKGSSVE